MDCDVQPDARPDVLYVEDNAVNAIIMRALFQQRPDVVLHVAADGAQAMRMAAELQPVLLLLDLRLPDCHGAQLLPRLRRLPGCRLADAVAVTAEIDFVIDGTGFVEQWSKPLDIHHVLARLDVLLPPLRHPGSGAREPGAPGSAMDTMGSASISPQGPGSSVSSGTMRSQRSGHG